MALEAVCFGVIHPSSCRVSLHYGHLTLKFRDMYVCMHVCMSFFLAMLWIVVDGGS